MLESTFKEVKDMRLRRPRTSDPADSRELQERELYGPDGRRYVERVDEYEDRPVDDRNVAYAEERLEEPGPEPTYPPIAQVVALIVGVFFLVLGAIALARTGFEDLTAETTVAGMPHTGLLGIVEIAFGVLLVMAAAAGAAGRGLMAFLGALALAWGIVVVVQPTILEDLLAMEQINGWVYLVAGLVTVLAGLFVPTFLTRRRTYHRYDGRY
jgi:hypothetical protein